MNGNQGHMRRPRVVAQLVVLVMAALAMKEGHAQQSSYSMTDTDLRAVYCLAENDEAIKFLESELAKIKNSQDPNSPSANLAQDALNNTTKNADHLESYLVPKLSSIGSNGYSELSFEMSMQKGKGDYDRFISDASIQQCMVQCGNEAISKIRNGVSTDVAGDETNQCTDRCAPDLIPRIRMCGDLSWLPF